MPFFSLKSLGIGRWARGRMGGTPAAAWSAVAIAGAFLGFESGAAWAQEELDFSYLYAQANNDPNCVCEPQNFVAAVKRKLKLVKPPDPGSCAAPPSAG